MDEKQPTQDEIEYALASAEAMQGRDPVNVSALGAMLLAEFSQAESDRAMIQERWLRDIRQYRGQYDPEVEDAIGKNRSRAFVRKTRVKIKTVNSRVADLLFPAGSEKNWEIEPTPLPTVSKEQQQVVEQRLMAMGQQMQKQAQEQIQKQGGDPSQVPQPSISKEQIDEAIKEVVRESSKKMAKAIEDQLTEARYKEVCIKAIHSGHLYGTGIIKGPLIERKIRSSFEQNKQGKWEPKSEEYLVPFVDFVPLWRFYPDLSSTELDGCRYAYERHQMTRPELAALAERKSFNGQIIKDYIKSNPSGQTASRYSENQLKIIGELSHKQGQATGRYDVLERWGWLDGEQLEQVGVAVPQDRIHESFFTNVWVLPNGEVIKAVIQPINGVTWPYHLYHFDKDETNIFGEGLASIMRDDQTMINAATRMILDNAAITAGAMLEVNPHLLSTLDNVTEVGPWKVWLRNMQNPGQRAVVPIEMPSNLNELSALVQMFENNADEVTAIPRYMTGESVSNGAAGTASGMSMLMGAVNIVIKDLITAWDEGITRSFLENMYRWNMQFNPDNGVKGDFNVKARGTSSLVAKEVRARQLDAFSASVANPIDAPFIKRDRLLRQRAEVNELSDVVKTEDEMKAESQQGMQQMQQQQAMAAQQQKLQMQIMQGQLVEMQAKMAKTEAETVLMAAKARLADAQSIATRVEAVYAALQAGGTAAGSPHIAPAGDEILSSSGWRDATPDEKISQIMGPDVQAQAATNGLPHPMPPQQAMPAQPIGRQHRASMPSANPATGMVGARAGIETARLDG